MARQQATLVIQKRLEANLTMPNRQTATMDFLPRQSVTSHMLEAAIPSGVTVLFSTYTIAIVSSAIKFTWNTDFPISTYYAYKVAGAEDWILATQHVNLSTFHQDTLSPIPADGTYDFHAIGIDIEGNLHYGTDKQFTVSGSGTIVQYEEA